MLLPVMTKRNYDKVAINALDVVVKGNRPAVSDALYFCIIKEGLLFLPY